MATLVTFLRTGVLQRDLQRICDATPHYAPPEPPPAQPGENPIDLLSRMLETIPAASDKLLLPELLKPILVELAKGIAQLRPLS